jgi:hypothetical protein
MWAGREFRLAKNRGLTAWRAENVSRQGAKSQRIQGSDREEEVGEARIGGHTFGGD